MKTIMTHYIHVKDKLIKNMSETFKDPPIIPVESTVAIHCKDSGPWTHGTLVDRNDANYND